jgi:hypothetical protein
MSNLTQKSTIESYFLLHWDNETPVLFENIEYSNNYNEWVRLSIQNADAYQSSLGSDNHSYRYTGVVFVQIFIKPNIGSGRAMELADRVSSIFRSTTVNGITFKTPLVKPITNFQEWYQLNVSTDFFRGE